MKNKIKFLVLLIAFLAIAGFSHAQEKYAVLITGDYAANGIPLANQWNGGQKDVNNAMSEFWYDTYLMWEMLVFEKGYSNENVFVIFCKWA